VKPALKDAGLVLAAPDRVPAEAQGGVSDLLELTKARLTSLVLVTTFVGFCLGGTDGLAWVTLLHCLAGTALVAGGAAAFNQWLERGPDAGMRRTRERPLPAGRMTPRFAFWLGTALSVAGTLWLALGTNALTAALAFATWAVYVVAYTPLKRLSSSCTLVGAVSGAIPPVIGYAAAGGGLDAVAAFLFGVLFLWQMPHFLAVNWLYREEYETAGFRMWSNGDLDGKKSARISVTFALALLVLTVGFVPPGLFVFAYYPVAALLVGVWLIAAIRWTLRRDRSSARMVFLLSIVYLPLVLGLMVFARA
jgi:protoheme IX farnesyltransferase